MREERFFTAEETVTNERIDKFLSAQMPDRSRSYIQKLIKDGLVEVNGKQVKTNYKLGSEDEVKLQIPELEVPDILPEEIPLDILYEDTDLLVVNKPKGMVVHPAPGHYTGTLVNALMYHCRENLSGINGVMRPGIGSIWIRQALFWSVKMTGHIRFWPSSSKTIRSPEDMKQSFMET